MHAHMMHAAMMGGTMMGGGMMGGGAFMWFWASSPSSCWPCWSSGWSGWSAPWPVRALAAQPAPRGRSWICATHAAS
jgi:hypothetical protein